MLKLHEPDSAVLMDWIYYHEVVSEFSLRHWAHTDAIESFCKAPMATRSQIAAIGEPMASTPYPFEWVYSS